MPDTMSEDEFWGEYRPMQAPDPNGEGGHMWEMRQIEFFDGDEIPTNRIWTVIDGDGGDLIASPGVHFVNRVGYVVTEKPWTDETRDAYYLKYEDSDN